MLLTDAVRQYLNAMMAVGRSPHTARGAKSALKALVAFLSSVGVEHIEQVTHDGLLRYREALSGHLTDKGTPLTARSQSELLGHLRAFCRWMVAQDWLVSDPSRRIPNPRKPQQLPKAILDEAEVAHILAQPDLHTASGYRDRVILEVLYSSAIRREEAAHLRLEDVDTEHGFLIVREGKNRQGPRGADRRERLRATADLYRWRACRLAGCGSRSASVSESLRLRHRAERGVARRAQVRSGGEY